MTVHINIQHLFEEKIAFKITFANIEIETKYLARKNILNFIHKT